MSKVDLLHNEAIILHDSTMTHDRGGLFDSQSDELVLTNLALIVIHKNMLGFEKDTQRFPLEQIKIVNNDPQVIIGRSKTGERQLHVYFMHGIEAFTLGGSDEDNELGIIESLFTSQREKESRNLHEWQKAICRAVLALPSNINAEFAQPINEINTGSASPFSNSPMHITKKCIGCMAPLSGPQGHKVICKYCDTEQVL